MWSRTNPYDELLAKATDEKQTEINWETALTVWDKVNEDGEAGARNCVAALQKRLNHRSANVQLFSLTLAGALVNNCGPTLHREISGKLFTQALTRLINDRTTHDTVRRLALQNIEDWVKEHPNNTDFDLLLSTYEALKRQGIKFPSAQPAPDLPGTSSSRSGGSGGAGAGRATDDQLRREEEELQRALAESAALADPMRGYRRSSPPSGYLRSGGGGASEGGFEPPASSSAIQEGGAGAGAGGGGAPKRVRALYDFEGQTSDELRLVRGDEVVVLEKVGEDWYRGQLRDRVGIFPVNYTEPLPDLPSVPTTHPSQPPPTAQGASAEDAEGEIFAQAASIDRLLALMQTLRARGEDFADNEELTDLYNSSMRLRPKVVQLIRKYEQKQADLQGLSDKVNHAKATYEQLVGLPPSQPYGQHAQPNGYGAPPPAQAYQQQPPPQAQPYVSAASPHPHPHQHQQQQQQQHLPPTSYGSQQHHALVGAAIESAQQLQEQRRDLAPGPGSGPGLSAEEQEQRREYERQYAEYERKMEEYNRQMAQGRRFFLLLLPSSLILFLPQIAAQQQQQQQQPPSAHPPGPDGSSAPPSSAAQPYYAHPADAHAAPPPGSDGGAPSPALHAQQPPHQQAPQQPVWDPQSQQWVWSPHPHLSASAVAGQAPAPALSPAPAQGYPAQTQPYGAAAAPVPVESPQQTTGLEAHMAGLAVSPAPGAAGAPAPAVPYVGAEAYPAPAQGQPHAQGQDPAWAAWHAAQAQAQAQGQQQGPPQ
ncbi:hypothetical protein JCM10207_006754 [Rhodosporidiobolus poonsookiae]